MSGPDRQALDLAATRTERDAHCSVVITRAQDKISDTPFVAFDEPPLTASVENEPPEAAVAVEQHLDHFSTEHAPMRPVPRPALSTYGWGPRQ